jgi:hypothetical protein
MNPSEEFRRFAGECRDMAKFARSPESKASWDRLAARWVRLAELIHFERGGGNACPPAKPAEHQSSRFNNSGSLARG